MKKIKVALLVCLTLLLVSGGCLVVFAVVQTQQYFGKDGLTVNVTDSTITQKICNIGGIQEKDFVKVGDIIRNNGVNETVYAIASDGSYITIPME